LKRIFAILLFLFCLTGAAQKDTSKYDRREEIISDAKRYRIHNNYLTAGFGYSKSTIRKSEQSTLGIDFNFHIKRQHFQAGILMSGNQFLSNNNLQGHIGYGYRIENEKSNIAFFAGPSYNTGVIDPVFRDTDTIPAHFYDAIGFYANVSYIHKLTYDIGIGLEAILEINKIQALIGIKAVLLFSGSYQGKSRVYNKHVKPKRQ
jgi:hypothetical protein